MQVEKTAQGKVRLYPVDGGEPVERWPVDARGMVASGEFSPTPLATSEAKAGEGPLPAIPTAHLGADTLTFDPIKTPSMDPVAGATSPLVPVEQGEAHLGAGGDVMTLPGAEVVQNAQPGASAATLPGTGALPKTTPLGQPTVAGTKQGEAKTDQSATRKVGKK